MRERSKPKADIPTDIPKVEVDAPNSTVATETNPANGADLALKRQIEALRHNEQLQRQHMEEQQRQALARQARLQDMRPPSREEKLAAWRQNGLSEANAEFLQANPSMIDHDQVTAMATREALIAGVKHDTDDFRHAVKANFDEAMRHLQAQAEPAPAGPFRPTPPPPAPSPASVRSALASAPVSRDIPRGGDYASSVPSRITLSQEERAIAQSLGLTDADYAQQKRRMLQAKARGELQT
jgi:hypothetical protein